METVHLLCESLKESPLKNPENILAIKAHARKRSKKDSVEKWKKTVKKITDKEPDISYSERQNIDQLL